MGDLRELVREAEQRAALPGVHALATMPQIVGRRGYARNWDEQPWANSARAQYFDQFSLIRTTRAAADETYELARVYVPPTTYALIRSIELLLNVRAPAADVPAGAGLQALAVGANVEFAVEDPGLWSVFRTLVAGLGFTYRFHLVSEQTSGALIVASAADVVPSGERLCEDATELRYPIRTPQRLHYLVQSNVTLRVMARLTGLLADPVRTIMAVGCRLTGFWQPVSAESVMPTIQRGP